MDKNELDKIFFEYENIFWFRSDFINKLNDSKLKKEEKEKIKKIFKEQGHYEIAKSSDYEDSIECFNELNEYLIKYICNSKSMPKEKINISTKLEKAVFRKRISLLLFNLPFITGIEQKSEKKEIHRQIKENILKTLYSNDLYHEFKEEELKELDLLNLLDILYDEIFS